MRGRGRKDQEIMLKKQSNENLKTDYSTLLSKIGKIIGIARTKVVREIDITQVVLYWQIGRYIVEYEQKGKVRAEYGVALLKRLAVDLMARFGRGFSERNLVQMRGFYLTYRISQTPSAKLSNQIQTLSAQFKLSWSHYCELLKEENDLADFVGVKHCDV